MFHAIVTTDSLHGMSCAGKLPWGFLEPSSELLRGCPAGKHNAIVFGRKTWQHTPFVANISCATSFVLSRQQNLDVGDAIVVASPLELARILKDDRSIHRCFVIGGNETLCAFRTLLSHVHHSIVSGQFQCDQYLDLDLEFAESTTDYSRKYIGDAHIQVVDHHKPVFNGEEQGFLELLSDLLNAPVKNNRTSVPTRSVFGRMLKYDLSDNKLPLLTTRRMPFRHIVEELLWFVRGSTDVRELQAKRVHIWDGNSSREFLDSRGLVDLAEGDVGCSYGFNLRHFGADYVGRNEDYTDQGTDQLQYVIDLLKNEPDSRRILFSYWNPGAIDRAALPPCHLLYHFSVQDGKLNCILYQRSSDYFLANNWNVVSACLLIHMLCNIVGYLPGEFTHMMGDVHLYETHELQARKQLSRPPRTHPVLYLKGKKERVEDFSYEDFELLNYYPHGSIRAEMVA